MDTRKYIVTTIITFNGISDKKEVEKILRGKLFQYENVIKSMSIIEHKKLNEYKIIMKVICNDTSVKRIRRICLVYRQCRYIESDDVEKKSIVYDVVLIMQLF